MGTSLFDPAQLGPSDIAKLIDTLRSQGSPNALGMAHQLPAMRSVANAPTAHMLPAMVSSAPAPGMAHTLPTMHSSATASAPMETPSAITALLQTLVGPAGMTPSAGPGAMGGAGPTAAALPGGPPVMQTGAPSPAPSGPPPISIGGQSMPGPMAAPLPAPTAPEQPHMLHRIAGLLSSLGSGIRDFGAPADAKGYDGLLSPDDIQAAKPGFLARLSSIAPDAPSPGQQYHANLDNIVKMRQLASATAEHARVLQSRREMATRFQLPPNPTIDDIRTNLAQQYAWAMAHGDEETMKDVGSRLSSIFAAPKPDVTKVLGPGSALVGPHGEMLASTAPVPKAPLPGTPEWKMAEDFKASLAAKYRVEPTQIIQGVDDSGQPKFFMVPKHGGAPTPIDGMAPKVTVKNENAQQELTRARAEAAVSEMNNGASYMHEFEQKLASGQAKIGNAGQILGSIANTFTHDDPASKAIQNSALSALNKTNPDLARYIRRALSFAEGESMISSRPSDFRTRMSAFLSAVSNGATPDMISDIESRRNSILTPLNRIYAQPSSGSRAPTAAPSAGRKIVVNGKTYTVPH